MANLFTITGNLLAETTCLFDAPERGSTARAQSTSFGVGGKGVNVASAFNRIARKRPYAVVFPAGYTGKRCIASLREENFCRLLKFEISGETRSGLVCRDSRRGGQTTFFTNDTPVLKPAFEAALAKIKSLARDGDFLAFCGSFAGWENPYAAEIADLCAVKNMKLCVDTYGAPLAAFAKLSNVFLLKINADELAMLDAETAADIMRPSARKTAICNVVITDSNRAVKARFGGDIFVFNPPRVEEKSPTCCGDVFLASAIFGFMQKLPAEEILADSAARASASSEVYENAVWDESRAAALSGKIKISKKHFI